MPIPLQPKKVGEQAHRPQANPTTHPEHFHVQVRIVEGCHLLQRRTRTGVHGVHERLVVDLILERQGQCDIGEDQTWMGRPEDRTQHGAAQHSTTQHSAALAIILCRVCLMPVQLIWGSVLRPWVGCTKTNPIWLAAMQPATFCASRCRAQLAVTAEHIHNAVVVSRAGPLPQRLAGG